MGKLLKYLLLAVAGLVVVLIVAATLFALLFDPNDYREDIEQGVMEATGRDFSIEGDLSVSLFPWLAIEMGKTTLGNAEGFSDEPFATFDKARLSVQVMPLLLRREISIGTAELDAFALNLEIRRDGRSNWQDLSDRSDAAEAMEDSQDDAQTEARGARSFEFAGLQLSDAAMSYRDDQLGEAYSLSNLDITTGGVQRGKPISIVGGFDFEAQPADTKGRLDIETEIAFDTDAGLVSLADLTIDGSATGETPLSFSFEAPAISLQTEAQNADIGTISFSIFDVEVEADIEPFSYAGEPTPKATISVDAFSPRSLMQTLNIEAPATADPNALGKLMIDAKANVSESAISLSELTLVLDDTTFRGTLVVPRSSNGTYRLDLVADSIDVNRYMEPAPEGAEAAEAGATPPAEIPADLIRALNARGSVKVAEAKLGPMTFTDAELGVNVANDQMRMHPITANFFDGAYEGDVRINASGSVPTLSVNERIRDVSLGAFAKTMFERDDITGTINGQFVLSGRGNNMAEVQRVLGGNLSFTLTDGAWEGRDVWWELRKARAAFKQEEAPEPELPLRTRFSEISATGTVKDGVLLNDDFFAELPFMQMNGRGTVDLPSTEINYSLTGRVLERPELMGNDVTAEELSDLTRTVIPFKITGTLAEPELGIDFGEILRERVEEEVKNRLLDELLGGDDETEETEEGEEEEELDPEDIIKDRLRDLLKN